MSSSEDTLSDLQELTRSERRAGFVERGNRLYQAPTITSPYPLPVDTPENERLTILHNVLTELRANTFGPVADVLSPQEGQSKSVVDLACGIGEWVMEMAREYPHVTFHGLDVVSIATREPEANVYFEIHDIGDQTRFSDASVDLVHARSVFMTVRDYNVVVQEAARILKPGGLFLSGEWGPFVSFTPDVPEIEDENPDVHVPGLYRFYQALRTACKDKLGIVTEGIFTIKPVWSRIPEWLESTGAFKDITPHHLYVPIGDWSPDPTYNRLGNFNRTAMVKFIESARDFLLSSGVTEAEFEDMYTQATVEINHNRTGIPGVRSIYYMVEARKT